MKTLTCRCGVSFTVAIYSNRKHCSPECRFRSMLPEVFTDECCSWPKSINKVTGYGQFNVATTAEAKMVSAHRMAYQVFTGPIPSGLEVLHRCDNRACVNPRHLFTGTQANNMADMWQKGRQQRYTNQPKGDANPARMRPERLARGERQGSAKLTTEKVLAIMASSATHAELARQYGVDPSSIIHVRQGKTWRHVTQASAQVQQRSG